MRKMWFGLGLIALLIGMTLGGVAAWRGQPGPNPYASQSSVAPMLNSTLTDYYADLSQEEIDGLLYMREEEKLARDVYLTFYEMYGLPIFYNIAQSEQTHTDTVLSLIEKYNLTDPASDEIGVFTNPDLQALYDQLVEIGSQSVVDALKIGALIEETDIVDLQERIAQTDNEDIKQVYSNLMAGSENHLRAFVSQLEAYGVTYEPQLLSEDYYQSIISSTPSHGFGGPMWSVQPDQDTGIIPGIMSAFRHAWGWMNGMAQRIRLAI